MSLEKKIMLIINVIGGIAVLGSYVYGIWAHPNNVNALWGDFSPKVKDIYIINIWLAVAGYFFLTYFLLIQEPSQIKIDIAGNIYSFSSFNWLYFIFLFFSALWMPFTWMFIDGGRTSLILWYLIRVILLLVGLAVLGIIVLLLSLQVKEPVYAYWLALFGSIFLCIQTLVLDAFIWPVLF